MNYNIENFKQVSRLNYKLLQIHCQDQKYFILRAEIFGTAAANIYNLKSYHINALEIFIETTYLYLSKNPV